MRKNIIRYDCCNDIVFFLLLFFLIHPRGRNPIVRQQLHRNATKKLSIAVNSEAIDRRERERERKSQSKSRERARKINLLFLIEFVIYSPSGGSNDYP